MKHLIPCQMTQKQLHKQLSRRKLAIEGSRFDLIFRLETALRKEVGNYTDDSDDDIKTNHTEENVAATVTNNDQGEQTTESQGQPPAKKIKRSKEIHEKQRRFPPTPGLCIRNLAPPLNLNQLQELLEEFGRIRALHLSQCQTHAFVYYEISNQASLARKQLTGLPFPEHANDFISLEFVTAKRMGELFEAEARLINAGCTRPQIVNAPQDAPQEWYGLMVDELDSKPNPPPHTAQPPMTEEITSNAS
ncbi:Apoptotic chromatin condensation inducer in the nucleus [Dispira simplex]|nr:Apoptotic chromatin condensation inducer in the nucleus [Dispira simplex]